MTRRKFSESELRRATGSRPLGRARTDHPFAFERSGQLVQELKARLTSTGGRPSLPECNVVRKVPFRKDVWERLKRLAEEGSAGGRAVSPGQIAAAIIDEAVLRRHNATSSFRNTR